MAIQASGSAFAVQSSSHALERLHRPLVDVLRPALDRHFADWSQCPIQGAEELAVALEAYFEAKRLFGVTDRFRLAIYRRLYCLLKDRSQGWPS
jgi:hypothetical protein